MMARSQKRGSATRLDRKKSIPGSLARQSGRIFSHPACRSASSTVASPCTVARRNRSTSTATGSVIASDTFGFAFTCSSFRENRMLAVVEGDQWMGDRAAAIVDDGQLADQRRAQQILDRFGKGAHLAGQSTEAA